jgi:hypothetical protein
LKTLLRLTASQGTSWIDAQQDATPKGKNVYVCFSFYTPPSDGIELPEI